MKKLLMVLLAVILCMSFAACGSKGGDAAPASAPSAGSAAGEETASIPVLMGGALPFTNMETLETENFPDGSYVYSDMTEDGMIVITNAAFPNDIDENMSEEEYVIYAATSLAEGADTENAVCEADETLTANLSYPAYIVGFTAGSNEDTRNWTAFVTVTDTHTYVYAFSVYADYDEDLSEIMGSIFAGLTLEDVE